MIFFGAVLVAQRVRGGGWGHWSGGLRRDRLPSLVELSNAVTGSPMPGAIRLRHGVTLVLWESPQSPKLQTAPAKQYWPPRSGFQPACMMAAGANLTTVAGATDGIMMLSGRH